MDPDQSVENLVLAVLSGGGYRLDRAFSLLPTLREQGIADPEVVGKADNRSLSERLIAAGYDRGPLVTSMMADRLRAVHAAARDGTLRRVMTLLGDNRYQEAESLCVSIRGVGPKIFERFAMLCNAPGA